MCRPAPLCGREREREEELQGWSLNLDSLDSEEESPQLPRAMQAWQRHEQRYLPEPHRLQPSS